jgi:sterol desaturase/sphingolipid hydroxylase (fatty acid hydroxylase superfamily)
MDYCRDCKGAKVRTHAHLGAAWVPDPENPQKSAPVAEVLYFEHIMIDAITSFFQNIPSWQRTGILASGLLFFWILEGAVPILKREYNRTRHLGVNLFFTFTTLMVNFWFAVVIIMASDWSVRSGFGILQFTQLPVIAQILIGLLLMDLIGAYFVHWVEHKVYWMWRFHVVHHTDMHVDTSTALRHHPGESVIRAVFTTLAVLVVGAPVWLVMLYQSLSAFASQFNHANLKLPAWVEKYVSYVIVTPGMHHVHHHHTQPYTDTNYGNIFSIWDRLFGTYAKLQPHEIVYGLDVYTKRDGDIRDLLTVPVDGKSYTRRERSSKRSAFSTRRFTPRSN